MSVKRTKMREPLGAPAAHRQPSDRWPVISDAEIQAITIEESGEQLVDLREYPVATAAEHPRARSKAATKLWCRKRVAERLVAANRELPTGLRLLVVECHRPLELQRRYWEEDLTALRARHPAWSNRRLMRENAKFVAPPWITPPHSTGGAVDLVLTDHSGVELDLGSELNADGPLMATAAKVPNRAAERRRTLVEAMEAAGFVNYPYEWWHFSFGDRYWAYISGTRVAPYGGI